MEIKSDRQKWAKRFMEIANLVATWSKDPSTQVGCVIADESHRIISMGYNGFPRGVKDLEERYNDRPTKQLFVAHAERNAIDNSPMSVSGCTLYTPLEPCSECAKSIIQNGIKKVVTYKRDDIPHFHWQVTRQMFKEAGVIIYYINEKDNDY